MGRQSALLLPPQCLTMFYGFGSLHILASTAQQCTSVTSGHALCQKPGNEQSNYCGLCLTQTWSGWNSRPFINNYKLVIINKIKVKGTLRMQYGCIPPGRSYTREEPDQTSSRAWASIARTLALPPGLLFIFLYFILS